MSAKVLAIANQKGGVGKTTTTVTLAAALTKLGYRAMVVDLDPHACASVHLRIYPDESQFSVNNIFAEETGGLDYLWENVRQHHPFGFDVVPANIRLSELEIDLRARKGKGEILQKTLAHVSMEYDFIILDCPPHVGILLINALVASDLLIIPIQTDFLALHGLKLLFDTLRILNKVLPEPIIYRALPTMFDRRARACHRVIELLTQKLGDRMFSTVIGIDTRFREASAQGRVILETAPESRGAREYMELAEEILSL